MKKAPKKIYSKQRRRPKMANPLRDKPFHLAVYPVITAHFAVVIVWLVVWIGSCIKSDTVTDSTVIDGTVVSGIERNKLTIEQLTYKQMLLRVIQGIKKASDPDKTNVMKHSGNAVCLLNQIGHPLGDSYIPKKGQPKKRKEGWQPEKQVFPDKRDGIQGDRFLDLKSSKRIGDRSLEEEAAKALIYHHFPGLSDNYIRDWRLQLVANKVITYKARYPKQVEWLKVDTTRKEGSDPFAETTRIKHEIRKVLLDVPPKCVRGINNECIVDELLMRCMFAGPLADELTRINKLIYESRTEQFNPMVCNRTNDLQAIYSASDYGCSGKRRDGLNLPCTSHHELFLAWDLRNWETAADFLAEIGMVCDFIKDDSAHCSFAETNITPDYMKKVKDMGRKAKAKAKAKAKEMRQKFKDWRRKKGQQAKDWLKNKIRRKKR